MNYLTKRILPEEAPASTFFLSRKSRKIKTKFLVRESMVIQQQTEPLNLVRTQRKSDTDIALQIHSR